MIHARRIRYTYGIRTAGPHVVNAPDKVWEAELGCFYTHNVFYAFVLKGQQVRA